MKKITIVIDEETDEITFDADNCVNSDCLDAFGRVLGGIAEKAAQDENKSDFDHQRLQAYLLWKIAENAGWDMVNLHENIFPELIAAAKEQQESAEKN